MLVEGILLFEHAALRELLDIKLFVDTPAAERRARRAARDVRERGRRADDVARQWAEVVQPMHERFVEPSRGRRG